MTTMHPPARATAWGRPLILLLMAAALASGVAWLAYRYLQKREAALAAEFSARDRRNAASLVAVAVPRADAAAGTVVDTTTFVSRPVEDDLVYPDTVLARDFDALRGRTLARPVLRGRPLRLSDMTAPAVRDVAAILPPGRRALTIDIDNVNSIAQTLRPSHHIDLYLLHKGVVAEQGGEQERATLYMQDVVVLATGTEFRDIGQAGAGTVNTAEMARPGDVEGHDKTYDTVTLLVTPAEAARLVVGQKLGSYRVALRGAGDRDAVRLATLRGGDLLSGPRDAAKARDAGIEFIVGGRGDRLISELALPPSQDLLRRMQGQAPFPTNGK
jgi:pilus assembly protein CpaB